MNGQPRNLDIDPNMPLLWVHRDQLALTGSQYGCDNAQCGACTLYPGDKAVWFCMMLVAAVAVRSGPWTDLLQLAKAVLRVTWKTLKADRTQS